MIPHEPKIAVAILGYDDAHNLQDAVSSVQNQSYRNFEVFYIDNASSDGSADIVRKNFPTVSVSVEQSNLGYAGAYAKHIPNIFKQGFDAVVLLNSDIVADKDWLSELLVSAYRDPKIGMAQPKIYLWKDGRTAIFNTSGNEIQYLGVGFSGQFGKHDTESVTTDHAVPYASGCSLLVKKEAFESVGNIDEDFFLYLEDQDWGWRARLKGWDIVVSATSKLWHKYDFNSKRTAKFFYLERNRAYFITKNYRLRTIILLSPVLLLLEIGILGHSIANGYFKLKIRAYCDFIHHLPPTLRKRKLIQQERIVSDQELFHLFSPVIEFESIDSPLLRLANVAFRAYYTFIRRFI